MVLCKYSDWTRGQVEALINIIGEDRAKKLLVGNISVEFKEIIQPFFDKHGRRIPKGLSSNVCDADKSFRLVQSKLKQTIHYADRIMRLHRCLGVDTGVTVEQFKVETERLLALIRDNSKIVNITNGVWLPVILPKFMDYDDFGMVLQKYLKGLENSYKEVFSDRKFNCSNDFAGNVSIVNGIGQHKLIKRMNQGPVIGIYFPNALQGFSINASCEQILTLPIEFILSGIDIVIAGIMWPEYLLKNWHSIGLDLSALRVRFSIESFFLKVYGDGLNLSVTSNLDRAYNGYSSGLLFLG